MSDATIPISYALYTDEGHPRQFDPVDADPDLKIEKALIDSDTNKLAPYHPDPKVQAQLLRDYVVAVPFDMPVDGHVIRFATAEDSRWDPVTKRWVPVVIGASVIYEVAVDSETAHLFLAVWTEGAQLPATTGDGAALTATTGASS